VAQLKKATERPSAEIEGSKLPRFPCDPSVAMLTRCVTCAETAAQSRHRVERQPGCHGSSGWALAAKVARMASIDARTARPEPHPMFLFRTYRALRFLVLAPFILVILFFINWMTFTGEWWVKWAALGIGIAWILSLFRVMRAAVLAGGLAALFAYLAQRKGTPRGM
jgi:hypothetical protein